jgi:hypothetical protein
LRIFNVESRKPSRRSNPVKCKVLLLSKELLRSPDRLTSKDRSILHRMLQLARQRLSDKLELFPLLSRLHTENPVLFCHMEVMHVNSWFLIKPLRTHNPLILNRKVRQRNKRRRPRRFNPVSLSNILNKATLLNSLKRDRRRRPHRFSSSLNKSRVLSLVKRKRLHQLSSHTLKSPHKKRRLRRHNSSNPFRSRKKSLPHLSRKRDQLKLRLELLVSTMLRRPRRSRSCPSDISADGCRFIEMDFIDSLMNNLENNVSWYSTDIFVSLGFI